MICVFKRKKWLFLLGMLLLLPYYGSSFTLSGLPWREPHSLHRTKTAPKQTSRAITIICLGANDNFSYASSSGGALTPGYKIICSSTDTLYDILGVSPTADMDEIKQAYRELARQTHPDVMPNQCAIDGGRRDFAEIAAAWTILSDPKQRAQYDRSLTFSKNVRHLITNLLDERLSGTNSATTSSSPSQTFTGTMEHLVSDLVQDVGQESDHNNEARRYLTQHDYSTTTTAAAAAAAATTTSPATITVGDGQQSTSFVTYYDILGVSPQATRIEIKQAYITMVKQTHPDTGAPPNGRDFQDVVEAWNLLSDPEQKMKYDRDLLAETFTRDVEHFVSKMIQEVGPSVQLYMERAVVPFIRQLTAMTLKEASRIAASAVIYWDHKQQQQQQQQLRR